MHSPVEHEHWIARAVWRAGLVDEMPQLSIDHAAPASEAWEAIRDRLHADDATMAAAVAAFFRTKVADLASAQPTATQLLPPSVARKYLAFPLADQNRSLLVATCDPSDIEAEREIGFASGRRPEFVVASPAALREAIELAYEPDRAVEDILGRMGDMDRVSLEVLEESEDVGPVDEADIDSGPAVKLANLILHEAIEQGASDIHIQPTVAGGVVRFRVDGVLRTGVQFPLPVLSRVVSRIKVVGRMDIADRLRPQDGRAQILNHGRKFDLRISTVPVRGAEKVVIRILDPTAVGTLEETRLPKDDLDKLRHLLRQRDGIVVVTGPTGSGKTTTLYGALAEIATEEVNIMTVEDPVEYELPGLAQIQVEPKKGVTFASALKAILRQDPDVIFVGEIRDLETAEMAAQASLTGHLVLATVHANDAVGAIRRLTDLGLEAATVVQTLRGALAQRLVRRVCPDCSEPVGADLTEEEGELAEAFGVRPTVRTVGCGECHFQGFRGRLPIAEILQMSSSLENLVLTGASPSKIEARARQDGMHSLLDAALRRVADGETTLDEVQRVLGDSLAATESDEPMMVLPHMEAIPTERETSVMEAVARGSKPVATPVAADPDPDDIEEEGPARVLLVDDDPVARAIARALLERDGFEVQEAEDGQAALDILLRDPDFSIVVLDLDMPRMGGQDALRQIRATPATASLPAIVLTGRTGADIEAELLRDGADDYLNKPIDAVRFGARVQAALRRAGG
jgi:type IV pilus assembly protein PilB